MEPVKITVLGMVWYRLEDYDAARRVMADGAKLPATYVEWRMKAEAGEKLHRRDGKAVFRAFINPETFPDWCNARGLNVDAHARNQFAAEFAHQEYMRTQRH